MINRAVGGRDGQRPAAGRPGGGPGWMGMGGPPAGKTKNVGQTLRRLLGRLRPEAMLLGVVAVLG